MALNQRIPATVLVVAIWQWIIGGYSVLGFILQGFVNHFWIWASIKLLIGVVAVFLGFAVWRLKQWSWAATLVFQLSLIIEGCIIWIYSGTPSEVPFDVGSMGVFLPCLLASPLFMPEFKQALVNKGQATPSTPTEASGDGQTS